jgi:hypothetical protein
MDHLARMHRLDAPPRRHGQSDLPAGALDAQNKTSPEVRSFAATRYRSSRPDPVLCAESRESRPSFEFPEVFVT